MLLFLIGLVFVIASCTESVHDVKLRDTSGSSVSLSRFKGRTLVVYVWSGTCIGHTEDLRELNAIYPQISQKAELITVAVMMNPADVKEFLKRNSMNLSYPVFADEKGEFARKVTLVFLPATLIFNRDGRLVESYPGLPPNLLSLISSH